MVAEDSRRAEILEALAVREARDERGRWEVRAHSLTYSEAIKLRDVLERAGFDAELLERISG